MSEPTSTPVHEPGPGLRDLAAERIDAVATRIAAGMNVSDLRAMARDDEPRRPNPRLRVHGQSFFFHIKPSYYHVAATKFTHTFRLGLLSSYLLFVETVTGILLMLFYAPTPDRAHVDILEIISRVPFGSLTRDVHRLAAEGMIIAVVLHMARTFLTGSYKKPRRFTWVTGVVLLLATLAMSFTGYLLPWDQLAYWAVTVGASIVGAAPPAAVGRAGELLLLGASGSIGSSGLLRFYLLHVLFVPLILLVVLCIHYYKVVRVGISLPASLEDVGEDTARRVPLGQRRYYLPDVLTSEVLFLSAVTLGLLGLVVLRIYPGAPLQSQANPNETPMHTQAPWFFLWVQGLLKLGSPALMGVVLPTLVVVALLLLPYADPNPSRRAADRRLAIYLGMLAAVAMVVLTWIGTAQYAVQLPPAEEVAQAILPEEGPGPLRALPWAAVPAGEWDTRTYDSSAAGPELRKVMALYAARLAAEDRQAREAGGEGLPNAYGKLQVENWQPGLKKATLRIFWQPAGGPEQVYEKSVFLSEGAQP